MKTVTTPFLDQQRENASSIERARKVSYKRRVWNAGTSSFDWDTSWTDLEEGQIVSVGTTSWSFDTETVSEFKVSNLTLVLRNLDDQWTIGNDEGILTGAEPYWTKWKIELGFVLADGSAETVTIFTGLAVDFIPDLENGNITVKITGLEGLLDNADAEDYATTETEETLGTGNNSTKDFYTDQPGVNRVFTVLIGTTTAVEGVDYSVSDLNSATLPAKVSMTDAPGVGVTIKATYSWWPQDVKIEDIVKALLTIAGIPTGDQLVDPVTFPNQVHSSVSYSDKAGYDTGTLDNIDDSTGALVPDYACADAKSVLDDFSSHDSNWWYYDVPYVSDWIWGSGKIYPAAGALPSYDNYLLRPDTGVVGSWQFDYQFDNAAQYTSDHTCGCVVLANDGSYYGKPTRGYRIKVSKTDNKVYFQKISGSSVSTLAEAGISENTSTHTIKITRTPGGTFKISRDAALLITYTDTSYSDSTHFAFFHSCEGTGWGVSVWFDNLSTPSNPLVSTWESPDLDLGSTAVAWDPIQISKYDEGGTILVETNSSPDGSTWEGYTEVDIYNRPQSTLDRHFKVRITMTNTQRNSLAIYVSSLVFGGYTSDIHVTLPVLTGKTVNEAISTLAQFANYEFGFYPDGSFFFRARVTEGDAQASLTEKRGQIMQVFTTSLGYDRLYSAARATYGIYVKTVSDDGLTATGAKARINDRIFEVSADSDIQIPATADVATGVAIQFFRWMATLRRRTKIKCALMPQLDLGDIIQIDYFDRLSLKGRIVGQRFDPEEWTMELDVEEVVPLVEYEPPFSPTDILGMLSWFDANEEVYQDDDFTNPVTEDGQNVVGWRDQGPGVFHMIGYGSSTYKPTWVAGAINGKPAVRFSDGNSTYMLSGKTDTLSYPATAFLVGKGSGGTNNGVIYSMNTAYYWAAHLFYASYDNMGAVFNNATGGQDYVECPETMDTDWHIWNIKVVVPDVTMQQDDGTPGTGTIESDDKLSNGGQVEISNGFSMDIAEVLLYQRALTEDEITDVKNYLKTKYDL